MAIHVGCYVAYYAFSVSSGTALPVTGDAANHTIYYYGSDNVSAEFDSTPTEIDATNLPGLYQVYIGALEYTTRTRITIGGVSSTGQVHIQPVHVDLDFLPNAAPGANGGLPTVDANNYVAGVQGTLNVFDDLENVSTAEVNTEVADVMKVDTISQPGQEAPAAAQTISKMIAFLYKAWRNKQDQSSSKYQLYNDDETTVDQKADVSESGGTITKDEVASGP